MPGPDGDEPSPRRRAGRSANAARSEAAGRSVDAGRSATAGTGARSAHGSRSDSARTAFRASGRHSSGGGEQFRSTVDALGALAYDGARVSASAIDTATGRALLAVDERVPLPVAGLGRVLLLIEVAAQLEAGQLHGDRLQRMARDTSTGPGLWQFLLEPTMQIADLATFVGATGDAWATNALLSVVGIEAIRLRADALGLDGSAVIDRVRDRRGPDDAPDQAIGVTAELSWLMRGLALGDVVDEAVSNRVLGWISVASDLTLVAGAFGLDPLAHRQLDHGLQAVAVTGSGPGVRSEAGVLRGPGSSVSYAVAVGFDDDSLQKRLAVVEALRTMGADVLDAVHTPSLK